MGGLLSPPKDSLLLCQGPETRSGALYLGGRVSGSWLGAGDSMLSSVLDRMESLKIHVNVISRWAPVHSSAMGSGAGAFCFVLQ